MPNIRTDQELRQGDVIRIDRVTGNVAHATVLDLGTPQVRTGPRHKPNVKPSKPNLDRGNRGNRGN